MENFPIIFSSSDFALPWLLSASPSSESVADNPLWFSALDTIFISYVVDLLMNDADDSYDSYNSGTAQQVFEWREGGGLFLAPLFLSNYFLFNLFLLLQKSRGGGAKAPPSGRFLQLAFD